VVDNVDLVVDTNILIDLFKAAPQALSWARQHQGVRIGIPLPVWFEVVFGARDKVEQDKLCKDLEAYKLIYIDAQGQEQAQDWFQAYKLSHGVDAFDCLIAATAVRVGKPLCTLNDKHFSIIPSLQIHRPY